MKRSAFPLVLGAWVWLGSDTVRTGQWSCRYCSATGYPPSGVYAPSVAWRDVGPRKCVESLGLRSWAMRYILICFLTVAFAGLVSASFAEPASLAGTWSGGGTVRLKSGKKEVVRCRINFQKNTGRTYLLSANCATTAATFRQTGRIVKAGANRYTGRFYSKEYDVSGRISISVKGRRQTMNVTSEKGTARLNLTKR